MVGWYLPRHSDFFAHLPFLVQAAGDYSGAGRQNRTRNPEVFAFRRKERTTAQPDHRGGWRSGFPGSNPGPGDSLLVLDLAVQHRLAALDDYSSWPDRFADRQGR